MLFCDIPMKNSCLLLPISTTPTVTLPSIFRHMLSRQSISPRVSMQRRRSCSWAKNRRKNLSSALLSKLRYRPMALPSGSCIVETSNLSINNNQSQSYLSNGYKPNPFQDFRRYKIPLHGRGNLQRTWCRTWQNENRTFC